MKRNLIGTLSLVVLSLQLTAMGAYAQSAVQTYVPFAFRVGSAQLPAGSYKIKRAEFDTNYITICNLKTGVTTLSLFQPESPRHVSGRLVFQHLGNQYFLAEIWGGAGSAGSAGMIIPASKRERKVEVADGPSKASKEVEIALK
jgi:hypothetical protein